MHIIHEAHTCRDLAVNVYLVFDFKWNVESGYVDIWGKIISLGYRTTDEVFKKKMGYTFLHRVFVYRKVTPFVQIIVVDVIKPYFVLVTFTLLVQKTPDEHFLVIRTIPLKATGPFADTPIMERCCQLIVFGGAGKKPQTVKKAILEVAKI